MNGAASLVKTLASAGVESLLRQPGHLEMHLVAALDQVGEMRCVLGLFEGVATGAADGYARMADRPASTLLIWGRTRQRARQRATPGAPTRRWSTSSATTRPTTSITMHHSPPTSRASRGPSRIGSGPRSTLARLRATGRLLWPRRWLPGRVATLIVPADASWNEADGPAPLPPVERRAPVAPETISDVSRSCAPASPRSCLWVGMPCVNRPDAGGSHRREDRRASPRADAQRAGGARGGAGRCRLPPLPGRRCPYSPPARVTSCWLAAKRRSPSSLTLTNRAH